MANFCMDGYSDLRDKSVQKRYLDLCGRSRLKLTEDGYAQLAKDIEAACLAGPGEGSLLTREEFSASLKRSVAKFGSKRLLKTLKNGPGF